MLARRLRCLVAPQDHKKTQAIVEMLGFELGVEPKKRFQSVLVLACTTACEAALVHLCAETKLDEASKRKKFEAQFKKIQTYSKELGVDLKRTMSARLVSDSLGKWLS